MRLLKPFQITVSAATLVAEPLSVASRRVYSALLTPKAGNVAAVLVGGRNAGGVADPKTELPLELRIGGEPVNYDLADLFLIATRVGDGVEIFGYE